MAKKQLKIQPKKQVKKTLEKKMANNHINMLEIKNFKSIKHMKIEPKRINLFIGKPNVGKSNILEAIGLLAGYYSTNEEKFMSDFIRYRDFSDLFYDRPSSDMIEIDSDIAYSFINYLAYSDSYIYGIANSRDIQADLPWDSSAAEVLNVARKYFNESVDSKITQHIFYIDKKGETSFNDIPLAVTNPIKKYEFLKQDSFSNRFTHFLLPPTGRNLYTIVRSNPHFHRMINDLFKEYKLHFAIDGKNPEFIIQKNIKGLITNYPYANSADTLQRYVFYMMAIMSNKNSVLLLEEPEAHSFPAYIRQIAEMIIDDKNNNQYFITTHSPFILNIILESVKSTELNIYKTYYDKHQTQVELLSDVEIGRMLDYGTDIFFNL